MTSDERPQAGSIQFAKDLVENAFKSRILRHDLTVKEAIDLIPDDPSMKARGNALVWSGYFVIYPTSAPPEKPPAA
jgi:hypothetical protein